MSKILNVVETAYRATLEEQDDPVVWIAHALAGAGADLSVLLRGNAVNYAVAGQDASGLAFGAERQTQPPRLDADVRSLIEKGVKVYVVEDDLTDRGIERDELIDGLEPVRRSAVAGLMDRYGTVWHW